MGKYFGTDGYRGEANVNLTADSAFRVGKFLGWYYGQQRKNGEHCRIVIGKDTRRSSYMFEYAIAAGITATGADAYLLHVTTTPSVAYVARSEDFDCGVMISASHNPYYDNGIKVINGNGEKLGDDVIKKIEDYLDGVTPEVPLATRADIGRTIDFAAGRNRYIGYLISLATRSFKGKKVALDCSNGSASSVAKSVFDALGADTHVIHNEPNGTNINQDCGSQHTENLCKTVVESHSRLGVAVDGDGDRIIVCDEKGNRLNGDQIIAYLTTYFKRHNMLKNNSAVATMYSNLGLGAYLQSIGVSYHTSAVGERYVIEKMREFGANVGGEESGHIVLSDYTLTGDALLASIVICLGVKESGKKMSEIFPVFEPYPTAAHNLRFASKDEVSELMTKDEFKACLSEAEKALAGHGSVIVRKSGTEPVMRLKIEDKNKELVNEISEKILACIKKLS